MLQFLRTTRGRVGAALLTSLVVAVLSLVPFREALPILPVLLVLVWAPVFTPQEPVSPPAKRLMLVLTGGLAILAGVGALVFVLAAT